MVEFLPTNHAVHRISAEARAGLVRAQLAIVTRAFPEAYSFCARVLDDLKLNLPLPPGLRNRPATDIADLSFSELRDFWNGCVMAAGTPESAANLHSYNLSQHSQLIRAFDDAEATLGWTEGKVTEIVADFPKNAADIEVGRNPGDVLDPYILAGTQVLLYGGVFQSAIGATVAHKALMIMEGLMGHLHEEVIGRMRGNMKAPEPRGENQELYDPDLNPFPGADIIQPPSSSDIPLRLHQVKSKTGTLNASGGARLAEQMRQLRMRYKGAEIYSHSLVGNTLRGHRSMGTMLRSEPDLIVTVGETAFRILTGSSNGAELLLRLYQNAFRRAAHETGYNIETMAAGITEAFLAKSTADGEGFLELMLHDVTRGDQAQQDSRLYERRGAKRRMA
jgi:hypothetical protein